MLKKIKEWLTPKQKNKIGRPKLAKKDLLKSVKIELIIAFVLCATLILSGTSVFTGKSPLELLGLNNQNSFFGSVTYTSVTAKADQFVVSDGIGTQNVCHRIYMPTNAGKNWRIHVYYKPYNQNYFSGIVSSTYFQYTSDKYKTVCFKKQNNNKETFRILVKWTTNTSSDIAKGTNGSWKPTGWSYKSDIGWAYKDYTIDWTKITSATTSKATTKPTTKASSTSTATLNTFRVTISPAPKSTPTIVKYNTVINIKAKFEMSPKKQYYMKWYTFTDKTTNYAGICEKMATKTITRTLTINNMNRKAFWIIYSDSGCKNRIKTYTTGVYTYQNQASAYYSARALSSGKSNTMTVYYPKARLVNGRPQFVYDAIEGGAGTACGESIIEGRVFWDLEKNNSTTVNTGIRIIAASGKFKYGTIIRFNLNGKVNVNNLSSQLKASIVNGKMLAIVRDCGGGITGYDFDLLINHELYYKYYVNSSETYKTYEGWPTPSNVPFDVVKIGTEGTAGMNGGCNPNR